MTDEERRQHEHEEYLESREHELYDPYRHQRDVHESKAKTKVLVMPVGSGKDICALEDTNKDMIEKHEQWRERPDTMNPKWHIWLLAPTYKLGEQLWRDAKALIPYDFKHGEEIDGKMKMPLIDGGLLQVRSADNPEYLVAEPVDRLVVTEAWLLKRQAWEIAQTRMSRPGRFNLASSFLDSTPGDKVDPDDYEKDNYVWEMVLDGMDPSRWNEIQAWYWFKEREKYGNLEHPILSLTPEGRAEIDRQRRNPNLSSREFRRQYLGEVMEAIEGVEAIHNFNPIFHVKEFDPIYQKDLWRTWDFGLKWPVVQFHQFDEMGTWYLCAMVVPFNQGKLDEDLADEVLTLTDELFPGFDKSKIHDAGDFEAVQQTDQRRASTISMLRSKGINLMVRPTNDGDEQNAIQTVNARMKLRQDGSPHILVHPRCKLLIRALGGKIQHETSKSAGVEYVRPNIAEIHPWIDIFDASLKYAVMHIPQLQLKYVSQNTEAPGHYEQDPSTGMRVFVYD